jgi:AraC family transcriptional regulator
LRPEDYRDNVRPDRTASYFELNPEKPSVSSRGRGWEGVDVDLDRYHPFDNGEVTYDEHLIAIVTNPQVRMLHQTEDYRDEGVYQGGDLVISPSSQPVRWVLGDSTDCLLLPIRPSFLQRVAMETMEIDPARVQLVGRARARDPLIHQIARSLLAEVQAGGPGERLFVESCSNLLALHLLRHYSTLARGPAHPPKGGLPGWRLRRAIDAIRDRLGEGVSLAEVAEAAGVSPSHFSTLFRRSTGFSPHQYLIHCRVERAKELIRSGDRSLSLAQVAAQAGFFDQSHLNRHFRRLVGITPSEFRKMS